MNAVPTVTQLVIILAALAAFGVVLCVAGCKSAVKEPRAIPQPGYGLVGASRSMEPFLHVFDLVKVHPIDERPFDSLVEGEIVAVMKGAQTAAIHRLVYKGKTIDGSTYWVTRGDNNPVRDSALLTVDNFGGVVTLEKRAAK
jgi:signal peptidase I